MNTAQEWFALIQKYAIEDDARGVYAMDRATLRVITEAMEDAYRRGRSDAIQEQSYRDLAASGGIVDAP